MGWQIAWEGEAVAESDLTLDEIGTICDLADIAWVQLHPLRHPRHLRAIVAVLKARSGANAQTVYRELGSMKGGEAIANIKDVPDDTLPTVYENGLPKAEDGPATTGSSGAPKSTDGPPTSPDDSESATSNS